MFLSLGLCLCLVPNADWPHLRAHGGLANGETKLPVKWSDENVLWKTPLKGLGVSSAIVSGDAVYLTFANADGTKRTLARFNVKTGGEEWTRTLDFQTHKLHKKNSFATATPATDGERVVTLFADKQSFVVECFDLDGKELWKQDVGGFHGEHGSGGSPIIEAGKVYFAKEQDGASAIYAFDLKTGDKVWQTDYSVDKATYSTPMIYRGADGAKQLVLSHSFQGLAGYDLATGKRLWKCDGFNNRTVGMPVQAGSIVISTAGEGSNGRTLLAVDLASQPTGDVELQPAYTITRGIPYCSTPIAVGERLYSVTDVGVAACFNAKTGEPIWSERLGGPHSASPVFANGAIFFVAENGDVNAIKPGDRLQRIAKFHLDDHFLATPAVANGKMYLRGEAHLWCVGAK